MSHSSPMVLCSTGIDLDAESICSPALPEEGPPWPLCFARGAWDWVLVWPWLLLSSSQCFSHFATPAFAISLSLLFGEVLSPCLGLLLQGVSLLSACPASLLLSSTADLAGPYRSTAELLALLRQDRRRPPHPSVWRTALPHRLRTLCSS